MNISFSVPEWKQNQIQNLNLKLQQEFYASTPYNLNDFKSSTNLTDLFLKIPQQNTTNNQQNNCVKKQITKTQYLSVAIFITYIYNFLSKAIENKQKNNHFKQSPKKTISLTNIKNFKQDHQLHREKFTERGLIKNQQYQYKSTKYVAQQDQKEQSQKQKNQQFQALKQLKIKIYQIDLCKLTNIPQKFMKYYNNNLLKKIIFQYLTKAFHNTSLIEILLENNQVLFFALSLVSQSLLAKRNKISSYNQNKQFNEQALAFLQHFENISPQTLPLASNIIKKQILKKNKIKSFQDYNSVQNFNFFILTKNKMKSQYATLSQQRQNNKERLFISFYNDIIQKKNKKQALDKKISKINKNYNPNLKKKIVSQKYIKTAGSNKTIKLKSLGKIKAKQTQKGWLKYLSCLKYFFVDTTKN